MFSSPNFIIGILSTVFIYFVKIESRTAGNVSSISIIKTGNPFFTEDLISCINDELVILVTVFLSLANMFVSHLVACP